MTAVQRMKRMCSYHEAHTLTAPTRTVIEHLNPETFDLNDISARPLSIASSSNLIEVQEPLDWINPANNKPQP